MIPKTIYRTWPTSEMPTSFQLSWNSTQHYNPTYKQILFTDQEMSRFMRRHYGADPVWNGEVYRAFTSINAVYGAARADLFRYALIYNRGGVYMDAKSSAANISEVLLADDDMVVSHWGFFSIVRLWSMYHLKKMQGEYQQWWLAAAPGHPALRSVIDHTIQRIRTHTERPGSREACAAYRDWIGNSLSLYLVSDCKGVEILRTTGPFVFTEGVNRYLQMQDNKNKCRSHKSPHARRVRFLWPNGNGIFSYDPHGDHRLHSNHYSRNGERLILKAESLFFKQP